MLPPLRTPWVATPLPPLPQSGALGGLRSRSASGRPASPGRRHQSALHLSAALSPLCVNCLCLSPGQGLPGSESGPGTQSGHEDVHQTHELTGRLRAGSLCLCSVHEMQVSAGWRCPSQATRPLLQGDYRRPSVGLELSAQQMLVIIKVSPSISL